LNTNYFPHANQNVINTFGVLYPDNQTLGSPFGTGTMNELTPEFKRIAAFQGDVVFQGPRRLLMQVRASKQPMWAFCEHLKTLTVIS
jgi:hypothetical protein